MNVARKYLLLNLKNIQGLPPELLRAVLRTLAQRRRAPQLQPAPQPRRLRTKLIELNIRTDRVSCASPGSAELTDIYYLGVWHFNQL